MRGGRLFLQGLIAVFIAAACAVRPQPEKPAPPPEPAPPPQETRSYVPPPRPPAVAEVQCPAEFSGACYPVWFGTSRKPVDPADYRKGFTDKPDERIHYGKRIVHIPHGRKEGTLGSPLWERILTGRDDRIKLGEAFQFDETGFAQDVRAFLARLDPRDRDVLVFIHGFNNSFEDAAKRAAQLGFDLRVPGITAFFSWPSRGRWDFADYEADRETIDASREQIAQFLVQVAGLTEQGRVHIIAHSMGNYGLLRALESATALAQLRGRVRFGQIFLAAPDVDVPLFRRLAAVYPEISERTTLYITEEDKAIKASEWLTRGEKVGVLPPVTLVQGVDTIQVRGVANLFLLGHSYFAENMRVLKDISTLIHFREAPPGRRARNQYPVPDESEAGRGSWIIAD